MEFLGKVGIDYSTLLAQIVNFVALVIILWALLYKPLLKIFEEREERTKKLAGDIEALEIKRKKTEEETRTKITQSEEEANKIIEQGRKTASQFKDERIADTQEEVDRMMEESRERLTAEQVRIKQTLRKETAREIASAIHAIVRDIGADSLMHAKMVRAARSQLADAIKAAGISGTPGRAEILSPLPLERGDIAFFTALLEKKLKTASKVAFLSEPALVAGLVVKFDSGHLFDFSFSGALEKKVPDVSRA